MTQGGISMNSWWVIAGVQTISIHTYGKKNPTSLGQPMQHSEGVVHYILSVNQYIQRDSLKKSFYDGSGVWVHIISPANFSIFLLTRLKPKSTWEISAFFTLSAPTPLPLRQRYFGEMDHS